MRGGGTCETAGSAPPTPPHPTIPSASEARLLQRQESIKRRTAARGRPPLKPKSKSKAKSKAKARVAPQAAASRGGVAFAPETSSAETDAEGPTKEEGKELFVMPVKQLNDAYKRDYGDGHPSWSPFYNHHGESLDYKTCGKEYGTYTQRIGPHFEAQNQRVQDMVGIVRLSNKRDHTWEHLGLRPDHIMY